MALPQLLGCDFSSRPTRRKPIVLARGHRDGDAVQLAELLSFDSLSDWGAWLARDGQWVGGFDLPFGLPRALVVALGWPLEWRACMRHYAGLERGAIRDAFRAFCAARPVGGKFAHRATDGPAGSSPSMKWVNPPVAWMLHAGLPPLLDAGAHLPGLMAPPAHGASRVALEAYPGLLARELIGRLSYKSDTPALQTPERRRRRADLVDALAAGRSRLGLRLQVTERQRRALVDDGSGDRLDAVLCLVQAAWAQRAGPPAYGLPPVVDPLEGWIVTAPFSCGGR